MFKSSLMLLTVFLVFVSCNNSNSPESKTPDQSTIVSPVKPDYKALASVLKPYEKPSQHFRVPTNRPSTVKGAKGTQIFVDPNNLMTVDGSPLGKDIEVELKELTNQQELLFSNAPTVSDGRLLVSGGAYYIGMTSGGKKLVLKEGSRLSVAFPKLTDKKMELFYGERDSMERINWKVGGQSFEATKREIGENEIAPKSKNGYTDEEAIDAAIAYGSGDSVLTPEYAQDFKKEGRLQALVANVYQTLQLNKMGWINCDRFLDVPENRKAEISVVFDQQSHLDGSMAYLLVKDANSVVGLDNMYDDGSMGFGKIPIGYKCRLIAYGISGEKLFIYDNDIVIEKDQKINLELKEVDRDGFRKILSRR